MRDTLPQIGYGQGDVVATPLRMAAVAAAVASNGVLREPHVGAEPVPTRADRTVRWTRDAARVLAGYMRDVVLTGTGRSLRAHPGRIAGKTGTAEVSNAAVARVVRRLRAVRPGQEAHRVRRHHRERRIRRGERGAGGRRDRHRGRGGAG